MFKFFLEAPKSSAASKDYQHGVILQHQTCTNNLALAAIASFFTFNTNVHQCLHDHLHRDFQIVGHRYFLDRLESFEILDIFAIRLIYFYPYPVVYAYD